MSVKKKDRYVSKLETLEKSRTLMDYLLTLTRPTEYDDTGKQIMKAGLLGEGQAFTIFGADMVKCGKMIHSCCYQATQLNLNEKNYEEIQKYYR
jgi:predicted metal-binding transcription factor (methanogenesis marker protein 9)